MQLPADLEAAIRSAPDDRAGYLAGDWLQRNGELIALALDGRYDLRSGEPFDAALRDRAGFAPEPA